MRGNIINDKILSTRILIATFLFQFLFSGIMAQQAKDWGQHFKISGFVKSNYWLDTRKVDGSRDDLFLYYPKKPNLDANNEDINTGVNSNYSAINTRLALTILGPDLLGAKVNGYIESDYTGVTNTDVNGLRLRHAYILMKWHKNELMLGQYWHPMFVPEVFPEVLAFNTGAPFQPFIRNPLISYKHHFGNLTLQLALIMQRDNSSDGPLGRSSIYMQEAAIPNSHVQLMYMAGNHVVGAAFDHKVIQPMSVSPANYKTNELLSSMSGLLYWKYQKDLLTLQFKSILGQNLTEHLMLGGYAVAKRNLFTKVDTYTPTNHLFLWGGAHYGDKYRMSLFAGYAKNLGTSDENIGVYYAKGSDVDQLLRISPSFCYRSGPLRLAAEIEWTSAYFGTPDMRGRVKQTSPVNNTRLLLVAAYMFKN